MIDILIVLAALALIGGGIFLVYKIVTSLVGRFDWATEPEPASRVSVAGSASGPQPQPEPVEVSRAGVGLAIAGAILMVVGSFLPAIESTEFTQIVDNTLVAGDVGFILIGLAVAVAVGTARLASQGRQDWSVFICGLIALGVVIYASTGDRLKLESVALLSSATETGSPGVGIWAAGAGAFLVMAGGLLLAGRGAWFGGEASPRRLKRCPDCAETVLADARVCKHCGHRFSAVSTTS